MESAPKECDVLLITVTEIETRAVLEAAKILTGAEPLLSFGKEKTYLSLGSLGGASILLVRSEMGSDSVGGATVTTRDALSEVSPAAVIMVGISFGVDPREQEIGRILVSKQLQGYDLQRVGTDKSTGAQVVTPRGDRASASPRLLDRLRTASLTWLENRIDFGLILSGQKLVDNLDYRESLRQQFPDAMGGEMEGAGVYAAAYNYNWILVKAIADWADGNKRRNKNMRQVRAAGAAARFVLHAINSGGFSSRRSDRGDRARKTPDSPYQHNTTPVIQIGRSATSEFADLWTPGLGKKLFLSSYAPIVGNDYAGELWSYSRKAIKAVEDGDFSMKLQIGRTLHTEVSEWVPLRAMGHYLAGEGNRLLADLDANRSRQLTFLTKAAEDYQAALFLFPSDPRPLRGLGRLLETRGEIGEALPLLEEAKAMSLLRLSKLSPTDRRLRPDAAHEALRTTRHLIHCLLEIRRTNKLSEWNLEHKTQQLIGYIVECENLHRELMPHFRQQERWWLIEWFMGLVFLARAWGAVGERARMTLSLLHALQTKRRSMSNSRLTPVDRINLQWWLDVAFSAPSGPDPLIVPKLEAIQNSLAAFSDEEVLRHVSGLLLLHLPPWETSAA